MKPAIGLLSLLLASCTTMGEAPAAPLAAGEHVYRSASGQDLTITVTYPGTPSDRPRPAMILLHGGGWRFGSPAWTASTAELMAANGIVALNAQYRLSVGELTPADALDDACAALAWARENASALRVDPRRIGFYGVSAGGHLAASTATVGCKDGTAPPDLLMLYSPAIRTSHDGWFQRLVGTEHAPTAYSPFDHVRNDTPPTFIVSGVEDTLTPHAYAVGFCEQMAAAGNRCEIEAFEGVGHLLTRNLANQESDFDVAPESIERARGAILGFLRREGFVGGD